MEIACFLLVFSLYVEFSLAPEEMYVKIIPVVLPIALDLELLRTKLLF